MSHRHTNAWLFTIFVRLTVRLSSHLERLVSGGAERAFIRPGHLVVQPRGDP